MDNPESTSTPDRGRSADVARYAAGLVERLEKAAEDHQGMADGAENSEWRQINNAFAAAFREAADIARQHAMKAMMEAAADSVRRDGLPDNAPVSAAVTKTKPETQNP